MNEILIIDDVIPKDVQDDLESSVMDLNFPWYYYKSSNFEYPQELSGYPKNVVDTSMMGHQLYNFNNKSSPAFDRFFPLLFSLDCQELVRMKLNLTFSTTDNKTVHGVPHIDTALPVDNMKVAIYYINDSDGDTIIFNEDYQSKTFTVKERITPRKGRMVVFPGTFLHAPSSPSQGSDRFVCNINYIAKSA